MAAKKEWRDGLYIAQPKDWEKIKKIISPYKGDIFPHLDDDYWKNQLDQGNMAYDNTGCILVANVIPDDMDFEGYVELRKGDLWLRQGLVAENLKGTGVYNTFFREANKNFIIHKRIYGLIVESNEAVKRFLSKHDWKPMCKYKKYGQIWAIDYGAIREQKIKQSTTGDGGSVVS